MSGRALNWFDALLFGIRQVLFGGVTMPERPALEIGQGLTAADDVANNATQISLLVDSGGSIGFGPAGGLKVASFPWGYITSPPTTLGAYGITDAGAGNGLAHSSAGYSVVAANGSIVVTSAGVGVGSVPWGSITGAPGTWIGYGMPAGAANQLWWTDGTTPQWSGSPTVTTLTLNGGSSPQLSLPTGTGHRYAEATPPTPPAGVMAVIGDGVSAPSDHLVFSDAGGKRASWRGRITNLAPGATYPIAIGHIYVSTGYTVAPALIADLTLMSFGRATGTGLLSPVIDRYTIAASYIYTGLLCQVATSYFLMITGPSGGACTISGASQVQINSVPNGSALAPGAWYQVAVIVTNTSSKTIDVALNTELTVVW